MRSRKGNSGNWAETAAIPVAGSRGSGPAGRRSALSPRGLLCCAAGPPRRAAVQLANGLFEVCLQGREGPRQGSHPADHHIVGRSEEHTSELQSLMRISYAVFCLQKTKTIKSMTTI